MDHDEVASARNLVAILQLAYSGELASTRGTSAIASWPTGLASAFRFGSSRPRKRAFAQTLSWKPAPSLVRQLMR